MAREASEFPPNRFRDTRAIVIYVAACLVSEIICPVAAQDFAPIPSCTSNLSSFAGIVCSGDAITGNVMHCVLNEHFQAGLVCSEWNWITAGRCPQYLEQRNGINDFACIGNEMCPRGLYKSYEVYKYPACLNSSLYITESPTEQPSTCIDCAEGSHTGSTTGTDTTTKSTLPTDSESNIICETSKQPMSQVVTVFLTVIVLMTLFMVLEYCTGKSLAGVICGHQKNGSCGHSTTGAVQVPQGDADKPMLKQLTSGQGSAAGMNHNQRVLRQREVCGQY